MKINKQQSLNIRLMAAFILSYAFLTAILFIQTDVSVRNEVFSRYSDQYVTQLEDTRTDMDFFFKSLAEGLQFLSSCPAVRNRNDESFTSFLYADSETFKYEYSQAELSIIETFSSWKSSHPAVSSVYMGRENGAFVRSHPRTRASRYDPRSRPWYRSAVEQPGVVVFTRPYQSVTNTDVNIGVVRTLQDSTGTVFGVIGIDVTLEELSRRVKKQFLPHGGFLEITDHQNTVLISGNDSRSGMDGVSDRFATLSSSGPFKIEKNEEWYRFSLEVGIPLGRLSAWLPLDAVESEVSSVMRARFLLLSGVLFLSFFVALFVTRRWVLIPLRTMSLALEISGSSADPSRIYVECAGELADFQDRYNNLVEAIHREHDELKKTKFLVVSSLASLAQKRDNETGLHILRTQKYIDVLANAYMKRFPDRRLDSNYVALMVQCAPLHDIGKVAIPDHILLKPGELSEAEFEIMKKHTVYGKEALERVDVEMGDPLFMRTALAIVYSHHERWDGRGYPEKLRETAIPLEARFMAIGDVYDALTTVRVYKHAYDHELAVSIIREGSGTQFDPDVVTAFLEVETVFREIGAIYKDQPD